MNGKAILASLLTIGVAATMLGVGTMAYFSDTEESTGNTFTAGTANIQLSNDGTNWSDGVSETWTMSDMAPGDTVTASLYIKNAGTVPIKALICDMDIESMTDGASDGVHIDDDFYMDNDWVRFLKSDLTPITGWACFHCWQSTWTGRQIHDEVASLDGVCPDDEILYWTGMDPADIPIGLNKGVLQPGEIVELKYTFSFRDDGTNQNNAQGDSLTLKYTVEARTNPCQ